MLIGPTRHATNLAVPRLMLEAEIALERGQPADALARLAELRRGRSDPGVQDFFE